MSESRIEGSANPIVVSMVICQRAELVEGAATYNLTNVFYSASIPEFPHIVGELKLYLEIMRGSRTPETFGNNILDALPINC